MPIPTSKGQYRKVEYTDDGCSNYQCLWCLNTIEIRDDPRYWNFCPKCGKSWFTKLECREHWQPRWFYDRFGEYPDHDTWVVTTTGRVRANDLPYHFRLPTTLEWYFECRNTIYETPRCNSTVWGEWEYEYKLPFSSHHNYVYAKSMLEDFRLRHDPDPWWKWEYRATLRKIT